MKRNEERIPGFDEIVFRNRNREYGAYDLRRRNKSVTSLSMLGTITVCTVVLLILGMKTGDVKGDDHGGIIVVVQPEVYTPPKTEIPEVEPPKEMISQSKNLAPKVVDDTAAAGTFIPIMEELIETTFNGDTNDIITVTEPPADIVPEEKKIFIIVEEPAEFPGGERALMEYINGNIKYPQEAIDNNIEGRVSLKFVVTEDGSVGEIILLKGVDPLLDREAVRVVGSLPRFKPGKQGGTPVCVWYSVPVKFQILR